MQINVSVNIGASFCLFDIIHSFINHCFKNFLLKYIFPGYLKTELNFVCIHLKVKSVIFDYKNIERYKNMCILHLIWHFRTNSYVFKLSENFFWVFNDSYAIVSCIHVNIILYSDNWSIVQRSEKIILVGGEPHCFI